jgi:electron transport complex protein RnfG
MKKDYIKAVSVLAIICLIISGSIAIINSITYPIIQANAAERQREMMSVIIPDAVEFISLPTDDMPPTIQSAYRASDELGYIFIISTNGFGGEIRIICGIDTNGRIIQIRTLSHLETKGIGNYIDNESFTNQFIGKDNNLQGIDSVTGATVTFNAFVSATNDAHRAYEILYP